MVAMKLMSHFSHNTNWVLNKLSTSVQLSNSLPLRFTGTTTAVQLVVVVAADLASKRQASSVAHRLQNNREEVQEQRLPRALVGNIWGVIQKAEVSSVWAAACRSGSRQQPPRSLAAGFWIEKSVTSQRMEQKRTRREWWKGDINLTLLGSITQSRVNRTRKWIISNGVPFMWLQPVRTALRMRKPVTREAALIFEFFQADLLSLIIF